MRDRREQSTDEQLHRRHICQTFQRSKQAERPQSRHILHRGQLLKKRRHHNREIKPIPGVVQITFVSQNEPHGQDFGHTFD